MSDGPGKTALDRKLIALDALRAWTTSVGCGEEQLLEEAAGGRPFREPVLEIFLERIDVPDSPNFGTSTNRLPGAL